MTDHTDELFDALSRLVCSIDSADTASKGPSLAAARTLLKTIRAERRGKSRGLLVQRLGQAIREECFDEHVGDPEIYGTLRAATEQQLKVLCDLFHADFEE